MGFPNKIELNKIRRKLESAEPSRTLPEKASQTDKLKFKLCEKFVKHVIKKKVSQADLARRLKIDPARLNEIVKYRIELFTVDKLLEFAERLDPNIEVDVA